jgi:4-oxalocrotonate tautomerase
MTGYLSSGILTPDRYRPKKTGTNHLFLTCLEKPMPYVNIQITAGATREQKAELVKDVTDSLVRVLNKNPEHTHVVIQDVPLENWGFGGQLTDELRRK